MLSITYRIEVRLSLLESNFYHPFGVLINKPGFD